MNKTALVLLAAALATVVPAQTRYAISLVGVSNASASGQGITEFQRTTKTDGTSALASTASSFTGKDRTGGLRTMDWTALTRTRSEYGRLRAYATGTLKNSYYNAGNATYQNGPGKPINPSGSPDSLTSLGFAGFTDTLQFGGALQSGYKARYLFRLDGTNSAIGAKAGLGVKIGNDADESFFAFDPGSYSETWATTDHLIDGTNPQSISVQFSSQAVFDTFDLADGGSYTSTSDFESTLTLAAVIVVDGNGRPVSGVTFTSASGTAYPVPEPAALAALGLGALGVLRRRR